MTDEQIIKALEICTGDGSKGKCPECAFVNDTFNGNCAFSLKIAALDIINRQKAEIEQLRHRDEEFLLKNYTFDKYYDEHITKAKSEAIKEFAERLKEEIRCEDDCAYNCFDCCYECKEYVVAIDNLVKEMTEGGQ